MVRMRDVLRGLTPGRMQTAGVMTVIPLIGDGFEDVARPSEVVYSTRSYGEVEMRGDVDGLQIAPSGLHLKGRGAQDHLVHGPTVIFKGEGVAVRRDASCVQSDVGGLGSGMEWAIAPANVRERAWGLEGQSRYDKMWGGLSEDYGDSNLTRTLERDFGDDLATFVAEFEPVPGQRGAIVLIGAEVMGVEVTPSEGYYLEVHETLIRDCYGAVAVMSARAGLRDRPVEEELGELDSLADLERLVDEAEEADLTSARRYVNDVLDAELEGPLPRHGVLRLMSSRFVGHAVKVDGEWVYGSLVRRRSYRAMAPEFKL